MLHILRRIYNFWKGVLNHFLDMECLTHAAALSYTSLLSIVPLMVVSLGIASAFPVFEIYSTKIQTFVFDHFVAASADVIQNYIKGFAEKAAGLSITSFFFLLVTAVMMIFTIEISFNKIWKVKERRHGVVAFLIYWAVLTLLPILIGVGFAISNYLVSLPYISEAAKKLEGIEFFIFLFPTLLTWSAFTILYMALPNCKVLFKHAVLGGIVAMLLFEFAKHIFSYYIIAFPTYTLIYGALATIPIFLVWIYVTWVIILLGAVVTYVLKQKSSD